MPSLNLILHVNSRTIHRLRTLSQKYHQNSEIPPPLPSSTDLRHRPVLHRLKEFMSLHRLRPSQLKAPILLLEPLAMGGIQEDALLGLGLREDRAHHGLWLYTHHTLVWVSPKVDTFAYHWLNMLFFRRGGRGGNGFINGYVGQFLTGFRFCYLFPHTRKASWTVCTSFRLYMLIMTPIFPQSGYRSCDIMPASGVNITGTMSW